MKEAVNEEHEGRRKNELTWKIHRIHWEKNRFIYDLMYVRKVMSRELVSTHSLVVPVGSYPLCRPSCKPGCLGVDEKRAIDMHICTLTFAGGAGLLQYDYLVRERIADGALIAKWRKPGYEILCSMLAIQKGNHNFGTTSHCRCAAARTVSQLQAESNSLGTYCYPGVKLETSC